MKNDPLQSNNNTAWATFLSQHSPQFNEVCQIVEQLNTLPEQLKKMELQIIPADKLVQSQQEWLWLCSKLDNPIENTFFKPWWVPVEKDSLRVFIDLSDPDFGIFTTNYFPMEPYQWYKRIVVKTVRDVLHAPKTGFDVRKEMAVYYQTMWKLIDEFGELNQIIIGSQKNKKIQTQQYMPDFGREEDEDGNLLNPRPEDIADPLPDEFMPDWYNERMKRLSDLRTGNITDADL